MSKNLNSYTMLKSTFKLNIVLVFLISLTQISCHSDIIIEELKHYDYLIGMETSDVLALDGFEFKTKMVESNSDGAWIRTHLLHGSNWILTSEIALPDGPAIIKDILVFDKQYSSCGRCLYSTEHSNVILTIHPYMKTSNETILDTYEINRETGRFKKINPDMLERNTHFLSLSEK